MELTELERNALLGNQKAQMECANDLIVLPCPKCLGKVVADNIEVGPGLWRVTFRCKGCGLEVTEEQDYVFFEGKPIPDGKNPLEKWNERGEPPLGRCRSCAHYFSGMDTKGNEDYCRLDGMWRYRNEWCSRFVWR